MPGHNSTFHWALPELSSVSFSPKKVGNSSKRKKERKLSFRKHLQKCNMTVCSNFIYYIRPIENKKTNPHTKQNVIILKKNSNRSPSISEKYSCISNICKREYFYPENHYVCIILLHKDLTSHKMCLWIFSWLLNVLKSFIHAIFVELFQQIIQKVKKSYQDVECTKWIPLFVLCWAE